METDAYTCSHCQRVVVVNPDRTRERGYCRKCDHVICDQCVGIMHQTLTCTPFAKLLNEFDKGDYRG